MENYWLNEYTKINKGDGYHFERFVCKLYTEYHDVDVKLNGKTNDKGVDLIIENKIGVQAKYYSTSLGIKPIQEVYAGISYYELNKGVVITNSSYNANAVDFAKQVGIELVDGNDILVMINRLSMGKKSPQVEKEKKRNSIEEVQKTKKTEVFNTKDNLYKTIKLYKKPEKAIRFENK